jgi:hypothetical protein
MNDIRSHTMKEKSLCYSIITTTSLIALLLLIISIYYASCSYYQAGIVEWANLASVGWVSTAF